ncbi:MAG: DUF3839 domain-containing protein [Clostridia bacterium]|nr:DUF3839 domain-containing protein [Clostridia bacterium]
MSLLKNCIFLSNSNIELMTVLRIKSLQYNIELSPCKKILEMIDLQNKGANAVLVEKIIEFEEIGKYISNENKSKVFYFQNNKVFDCNNNLVFKNIESFFKSKIFKQRIKNFRKAKDEISVKLTQLGIVFNTWQSRCIKQILECKLKDEISTDKILNMVSINYGCRLKVLYDSIRPILKDFVCRINLKTKQQNNISKIHNMINTVYNYCCN